MGFSMQWTPETVKSVSAFMPKRHGRPFPTTRQGKLLFLSKAGVYEIGRDGKVYSVEAAIDAGLFDDSPCDATANPGLANGGGLPGTAL